MQQQVLKPDVDFMYYGSEKSSKIDRKTNLEKFWETEINLNTEKETMLSYLRDTEFTGIAAIRAIDLIGGDALVKYSTSGHYKNIKGSGCDIIVVHPKTKKTYCVRAIGQQVRKKEIKEGL